ncbi:MAG: hypothetical protein WKH64_13605, partial [Chloroflexia bacterium]
MDLDRALASLTNILSLEQRREYNNRAVMGGLENFLHRTLLPTLDRKTGASSQEAALVRRVAETLAGYSALGAEERSERVRSTLAVLRSGLDSLQRARAAAANQAQRSSEPNEAAEAPPPAPPLRLRQAPTRAVPPRDESIARL